MPKAQICQQFSSAVARMSSVLQRTDSSSCRPNSDNSSKSLCSSPRLFHKTLISLSVSLAFSNKDDLSRDRLNGINVVLFAGSQTPLTPMESSALKDFVSAGGSVLILGSEGARGSASELQMPSQQQSLSSPMSALDALTGGASNQASNTAADLSHWNHWLSEYGIQMQSDTVVRTTYASGFFHPKEALIRGASIITLLDRIAGKKVCDLSHLLAPPLWLLTSLTDDR